MLLHKRESRGFVLDMLYDNSVFECVFQAQCEFRGPRTVVRDCLIAI